MRNIINLIFPSVIYFAFYPFLFLLVSVVSCRAQEIVGQSNVSLEHPESYFYKVEGRPDPFKPFISKKATAPVGRDPNEVLDEKTELTGMQLFEPSQLTLVGVMMSETGELALVEDQTKKGYILKRGDLIGKRGVVSQIDKQQVVITETAHTRAGEEINSTIIMSLKNEGDK